MSKTDIRQKEEDSNRDDHFICRAEFIDKTTGEVLIEAYVVPNSISKFPSFFGRKQQEAEE